MGLDNTIESYTTFEIEKILQIPRTRLQDWLARDYIWPSLEKSEEKGEKNRFSRDDLYCIYLFDRMMSLKQNRDNCAKILRRFIGSPMSRLVMEGKSVYVVKVFLPEESGSFTDRVLAGTKGLAIPQSSDKIPRQFEEDNWMTMTFNLKLIIETVDTLIG